MIKADKEDNQYVLIDYTDILMGITKASKYNEPKIQEELNELFLGYEEEVMIGTKSYRRVKKNNIIVPFLIEKVNVINYETFINHDILKDALVRAHYEFNHQMKNKLSDYLRKYVDNEINGLNNIYLIEEIRNDKELLKYIKKYENFTDYLEDKVNKKVYKM